MFPIPAEREVPDALAIGILRCEGPSAPCTGKLSRVLFTSRLRPTAYEVIRPHSLSEVKRSDGSRLAVMTAADLRRAEGGDAEVRFLHVEVTEVESASSYEIVTGALTLDRTGMTVMLCGTERFRVRSDGGRWSCERISPGAP